MKKLMFLAAIAAVAVGCEKDNTTEMKMTDDAIGFRSGGTKVFEEMDLANVKSMAIFGEWVDDTDVSMSTNQFDFAFDKVVNRAVGGGTTWTYEPTLYWPVEGNVNFYAYSPARSVNVTNFDQDDATPVISYVNPDNADATAKHQEDLMVAATLGQNKTNPGSAAVAINFFHALSQAQFIARNPLTDLIFEVEEIRILNLDATASFDLSQIGDGNGDYVLGRPLPTAWTLTEDDKTVDHYALENGGIAVNYRTEANVYKRLGDAITIIPQAVDSMAVITPSAGNSAATPTAAEDALTAAQAGGKQIIALKFRVLNANGSVHTDTTWAFFNFDLSGATYNGSLDPAITTNSFVMGARYTFAFTLTGAGSDPNDPNAIVAVNFGVNVNGWNDPTEFIILD